LFKNLSFGFNFNWFNAGLIVSGVWNMWLFKWRCIW